MNKENQNLMDEIIKNKLELALDSDDNDEIKDALAMAINVSKAQTESEKLEYDSKKTHKEHILKAVEIAVGIIVPITVPVIEVVCRKSYANVICEFEKESMFTSTAGKSLGSLFRFK